MNRVLRPARTVALAVTAALVFAGCDSGDLAEQSDQVASSSIPENGEIIEGQYIVILNESSGKASQIIDEYESRRELESTYEYDRVVTGFAGKLTPDGLARLQDDRRVKYVEPDRFVTLGPNCDKNPSHPKCGGGGDPGGGSQETPWGVAAVGGPVDGTGKVACVIDTGVDLNHPDLTVDVGASRTFVSFGKDSKNADDGNGHGTHVAGTIGANDDGSGVVGVAAGATIIGIKVLDRTGSGSYSAVIAGVNYAAQAGCSVANMSLGGPASNAVDDAVESAAAGGLKFALAAGNESQHAGNVSPARANHNNIYTVSAVDANGDFAYFSNYGNPPVDYAAPGVSVLSTYKGGGTSTLSGTSMASPHVAGILLMGSVSSNGTASNDPDGSADPLAHL